MDDHCDSSLSMGNIHSAELASRILAGTVRVSANGRGSGSGVLIEPAGTVVTNAHVATRPELEVQAIGGSTLRAEVAARDASIDLALLRIEDSGAEPLPIRDSDSLRVGEIILSTGNPWGMAQSVAMGVIHSLPGERLIAADIRLAPGYSGGGMVDATGALVGINTMISGGLGLAVPSNTVTRFVRTWLRPRLGFAIRPVSAGGSGGRPDALLITEVADGSPAHRSGLMVGDLLTPPEGRDDDVSELLSSLETDADVVNLQVLRGGREMSIEIRRDHWTQPASRAA